MQSKQCKEEEDCFSSQFEDKGKSIEAGACFPSPPPFSLHYPQKDLFYMC